MKNLLNRWLSPTREYLAQRITHAVAIRICRSPALSNELIEHMSARLAQRLTITPVLFGGGWERVKLGAEVRLANTLINVTSGKVEIGDYSFFGHNVCLLTGTHFLDQKLQARQAYPTAGRDIIIGRGVWIASNATISGPCVIGDNAAVAAGAVVLGGELESGWLYGGVPARKLKRVFQE
jgi:acetyltransferase-like isoleucine patch superfamily enzyme